MRYFKYKNTNKNINNALKEQYKILTEQEKIDFRKEKKLRKLRSFIAANVFLLFMVVAIEMIILIPTPNWWLWEVLVIVGKIFIFLPMLLGGVTLAYIVTIPLYKKIEALGKPKIKKEIFSKACAHLRDYYGVKETYIVTKCYDAMDQKFKNHDVCIFVRDNELCITADLMYGFLYGERDLGCYAFKREEIRLSKQQDDKRLVAKLESDNTFFLLGYRAKKFIQEQFIVNEFK